METVDLESVEASICFKRQLVSHPGSRTSIVIIETHDQHSVNGIYDSVSNSTCVCQVGSVATDGMVFVGPHGIPL